MKINIVEARGGTADRVLSRMAADLAMATGWSISTREDPAADCNVFIPYLELRERPRKPAVAWFTHLDAGVPAKVRLWEQAATWAGVRTATARMYVDLLKPYGPTVQVPPSLDLEHFALRSVREHRAVPRIGVSGFVYASGRKGEQVLTRLVRDLQGKAQFVASGVGWPVPTEGYSWATMPKFYHGLDVLLCTSTIEGIPMPPLEALACGVPIVVPHGVGMMDELGECRGIYRYRLDDYAGLLQALLEALAGPYDPRELRTIVSGFTREAWGRSFEDAVRLALGRPAAVATAIPAPANPTGRGVYLVAFGAPAKACARTCVASIRAQAPGLEVCLVSDEDLGIADYPVIHREMDIGARHQKLMIDDLAPKHWSQVLYLDADTELAGSIEFLFRILERWEFVICKDMDKFSIVHRGMSRYDRGEYDQTVAELGSDQLLLYNGGVFGFRRGPRTAAFFKRWQAEYERWCQRDQGALLRALQAVPLRMYLLGNTWNCSDRYPIERRPVILHHNVQARRWNGQIPGRLDDKEAWQRVKAWNGVLDP